LFLSSPLSIFLIPAIPPLLRFQAGEDDIVPLSQPIVTADGKTIDSIFIPKGTTVMVPISGVNTMEEFWGPDSAKFNPERWLKVEESNARHLTSYRHLMTFVDGPRTCLGKGFAVAEAKVPIIFFLFLVSCLHFSRILSAVFFFIG
jgi:hypothetical protein